MFFSFNDVSIKYGKKEVLNNVNISFKKGSISTIIGKNGCGKSSLLKTLTKKVFYHTGKIILKGKNIKDIKRKEVAKTIAYLPQRHHCPRDISVRTLVSYGRYPHLGFGKQLTKKDEKIIDNAMLSADIKHLENRDISTLSGGEIQRAWIAMCVCQEPEIFILDEPTTYLDVCYQIEALELIKRLNKDLGMTVIMVLHDINLASRYSDYIYAIKDRKIHISGNPKDIITEKTLHEIFNIDAKIIKDCEHNCPLFIPKKLKCNKCHTKNKTGGK